MTVVSRIQNPTVIFCFSCSLRNKINSRKKIIGIRILPNAAFPCLLLAIIKFSTV